MGALSAGKVWLTCDALHSCENFAEFSWTVGEGGSARPRASTVGGQGLQIADHDGALAEIDDTGALPVLQVLVDAFARTADQLAKRALRDLDADRPRRQAAVAILFGEPDQDLGDPRLEIEKGQIL